MIKIKNEKVEVYGKITISIKGVEKEVSVTGKIEIENGNKIIHILELEENIGYYVHLVDKDDNIDHGIYLGIELSELFTLSMITKISIENINMTKLSNKYDASTLRLTSNYQREISARKRKMKSKEPRMPGNP